MPSTDVPSSSPSSTPAPKSRVFSPDLMKRLHDAEQNGAAACMRTAAANALECGEEASEALRIISELEAKDAKRKGIKSSAEIVEEGIPPLKPVTVLEEDASNDNDQLADAIVEAEGEGLDEWDRLQARIGIMKVLNGGDPEDPANDMTIRLAPRSDLDLNEDDFES